MGLKLHDISKAKEAESWSPEQVPLEKNPLIV